LSRLWICIAALALMPAWRAQSPLSGELLDEAQRLMGRLDRSTPNCKSLPEAPRLTYALRQTARLYVVVPNRLLESRERLEALFWLRVRSREGGDWRYFGYRVERELRSLLRDPRAREVDPKLIERYLSRVELIVGASLVFGAGRYEWEAVLLEKDGPVCRAASAFSVGRAPKQDGEAGLEPGEILTSGESFARALEQKPKRPGELLVLVNVGRIRPYRTGVDGYEASRLLNVLQGLMERMRFERTRVVAVSFDQQDLFYDEPDFGPREFADLYEELRGLELGTISVSKLANKSGHQEVLSDLFRFDHGAPKALVMIGFTSRFYERPLGPLVEKLLRLDGKVYYLHVRVPFAGNDVFRDLLDRLARDAGGRAIDLFLPKDLAEALERLEQALPEGAGSAPPNPRSD
jgi:hypothetical protein